MIDFRERIILLGKEAQAFGRSEFSRIFCAKSPELPTGHQAPAAQYSGVKLRHVGIHRAKDVNPEKFAEQAVGHI